MDKNLNQYLSDVFRNEVQKNTLSESNQSDSDAQYLNDGRVNQFLTDRKYALRLDEII